jgi:hypothetical protein
MTMKKLLTSLVALPLAAFSQVPQQGTNTEIVPQTLPPDVYEEVVGSSSNDNSAADEPRQRAKRDLEDTAQVIRLGVTRYDLQSNSSVGRRIKVYEDGRVSAVWTQGTSGPRYPDRGTGYNHFNGNEWKKAPGDVTSIENTRTGWPNIGTFGSGDGATEFTMTHIAGDNEEGTGGYVFSENSEVGKLDFSSEVRNTTTGPTGPIWYRSAASGDTLYAIANYNLPDLDDNTDLTLDLAKSRNDIKVSSDVITPTVFYRSTDGGQTFDQADALLPGYGDSSQRFRGVADEYAIDARDSIVAIAIANSYRRIDLWKSSDAGNTWNRTTVRELGISTDQYLNGEWGDTDTIPLINQNTGDTVARRVIATDTLNDGSISTVIDEQGNVHLTWANTISARYSGVENPPRFNEDTAEITQPVRPTINVIQYWNDEEKEIVDAGSAPTLGGPDDTTYTTPTAGSSFGAYQTSASTRPMVSYLSPDTLFVVYEGAVALTNPGLPESNNNDYRDIYTIYSTDGGSSWSEPLNITKNATDNRESVYPSVNKRIVNNQLHLIWQEDPLPGSAVGQVGIQSSATDNDILYTNVNIDNILADTVKISDPTDPGGGGSDDPDDPDDPNDTTSVVDPARENGAELAVYPNPAQKGESVKMSLSLDKPSNVRYTVVNAVGQVQYAEELGKVSSGQREWQLPTDQLSSGVYFIRVTADETTLTQKLIQP